MSFSLLFFLVQPLAAKLISKPVGEVNGHIVTSREVQLNYLVERALIWSPKKFLSSSHRLDVDSVTFRNELNGVFLEWVVDLQAQLMSIASVPEADLQQAIQIVKMIEKTKVWPDVLATREELRGTIVRKLRAKRFIKERAEASQVEPTDEEVREFYESNRALFGSLSYDKNIERIRRLKRRQDAGQRLQDWFRNLQQQYQVKSYLVSEK